MKGARRYASLFKTGQYGRLYIVSGHHARGKTFRIYVLPEGEDGVPNGCGNPCLNKNKVEVYGVISGQPGWTETYGWLHKGKWCDDFEELVKIEESRRMEIEKRNLEKIKAIINADKKKEQDILSTYK